MIRRTFSWRTRTATGPRAIAGSREACGRDPADGGLGVLVFEKSLAGVGDDQRGVGAFGEIESVAGGCDVGGAVWRALAREGVAGEAEGEALRVAQAMRCAGDGGGGIGRDALQGIEARGEAGRGDRLSPFVVTAAPVCEA